MQPFLTDTERKKIHKALRKKYKKVAFEKSAADNLPFAARDFDAIISNGSFNLVLDKSKALSEVYRVLKPQGRSMIAEQVLNGELPKEKKQIIIA